MTAVTSCGYHVHCDNTATSHVRWNKKNADEPINVDFPFNLACTGNAVSNFGLDHDP